jgi:hypothetical protein
VNQKQEAAKADQMRGATGAYGLRLDGITGARRILGEASDDWPVLRVEQHIGGVDVAREMVDDERAAVRLQAGVGSVCIDRATLTAQFNMRERADDEAIVHPFLALTAAIVSRWLGRDTFHAGAFVVDGGAWAVLGKKGAGKSSTLGFLGVTGTTIVTDDLLVLDDGDALAGPSCVDLRPDAAAFLQAGEDLGVVGARSRVRVVLPGAPARVPLRGWVFPSWSDTLEVVPVPVARRLPMIAANLALHLDPPSPERFLEFAALPCFEFRRPQRFDLLDRTATLLLDRLRG